MENETSRRRLRLRRMPTIKVIPSLLTLSNGVCGFAAIIIASRIHREQLVVGQDGHAAAMDLLSIAGWLIFGGMLFDVLDGRFARLTGSASRFGSELDSLCDVITFGAAPAFLLLKIGPTPDRAFLYKILFVAATFYVICTILRLARFNIESQLDEASHRIFKGLPSPAAAGCIAAVAILRNNRAIMGVPINLEPLFGWIGEVMPFLTLGIAFLMVSSIEYPHMVNQFLRGRRQFAHLIEVLLLVLTIVFLQEWALLVGFWAFAASGLVRLCWRRPVPQEVPQAGAKNIIS